MRWGGIGFRGDKRHVASPLRGRRDGDPELGRDGLLERMCMRY